MSDEGFLLTKQQLDTVSEWFNEYAKETACAVCGSEAFMPVPVAMTRTIFDPSIDRHRLDKLVGTVQVQCKKCANVLTFHASSLGIEFSRGEAK